MDAKLKKESDQMILRLMAKHQLLARKSDMDAFREEWREYLTSVGLTEEQWLDAHEINSTPADS